MDGGGGSGGAPGGGGGRGGGGGLSCLRMSGPSLREGKVESVCADTEDRSEVVMELLSSLLQLSGSLDLDEPLMPNITKEKLGIQAV